MANLHFTTISLCHTLLRLTGQTASSSFSSSITMSTTSISAISMSTSQASKGQATSSGITMSTPMSISSTNTSPAGGGQSATLPSSTTVLPTSTSSTPSSTTSPAAQGFKITYKIKDGECKRVCCDGGAGGPVKMIPTCNPPSQHSNCTKEAEEDDRCPGEARDVCSSICGSRSAHCASFALVGLLAIAAFFK